MIDTETTTEPPIATRRITWGRVGLTLAASTALIWLAAILMSFIGPTRDGDYISDRTFFDAARPICKAAQSDVTAIPNALETPEPADRLAAIKASTDRLQRMVDDLTAVVPDTAANEPVRVWLSHWGIHLRDRQDFMDRVRKFGTDERFVESPLLKTQVSKSINRFAEVNDIGDCVTPDDV